MDREKRWALKEVMYCEVKNIESSVYLLIAVIQEPLELDLEISWAQG